MARTPADDQPTADVAVAVPTVNPDVVLAQDESEYTTLGRTRVATRAGYAFAATDKSLPVITSDGLLVTQPVADVLLAESDSSLTGVEDLLSVTTEQ